MSHFKSSKTLSIVDENGDEYWFNEVIIKTIDNVSSVKDDGTTATTTVETYKVVIVPILDYGDIHGETS